MWHLELYVVCKVIESGDQDIKHLAELLFLKWECLKSTLYNPFIVFWHRVSLCSWAPVLELCRPGRSWTRRSSCLCPPSAGIKGMCHHCLALTTFFEIGPHYVAIVGLELATWTRIASNSQSPLPLTASLVIKGLHYHAWLLFSNFEISNLLLSTEVSILSNTSPNLILPVQLKVK